MKFTKTLLVAAALMAASTGYAADLTLASAAPASGSTISELRTLALTFEGLNEGYNLDYDGTNGSLYYSFNNGELTSVGFTALNPSINGNTITFTLPQPQAEEGSYSVYVPANVIYGVSEDGQTYQDPASIGTIESGDYAGIGYIAKLDYTVETPQEPITITYKKTEKALDKNGVWGGNYLFYFDITNNTDQLITNLYYNDLRLKPYTQTFTENSTDASVTTMPNVNPGESAEFTISITPTKVPGTNMYKIVFTSYCINHFTGTKYALNPPVEVEPISLVYTPVNTWTSFPKTGSLVGPQIDSIAITFPEYVVKNTAGDVTFTSTGLSETITIPSTAASLFLKKFNPDGSSSYVIAYSKNGTYPAKWAKTDFIIDGYTASIKLPKAADENTLYYFKSVASVVKYIGLDNTGKEVTKNSQIVEIYFCNDQTVGVNKVVTSVEVGDPVFYDLQGRMVKNPEHGIYIKRVGNRTFKIRL